MEACESASHSAGRMSLASPESRVAHLVVSVPWAVGCLGARKPLPGAQVCPFPARAHWAPNRCVDRSPTCPAGGVNRFPCRLKSVFHTLLLWKRDFTQVCLDLNHVLFISHAFHIWQVINLLPADRTWSWGPKRPHPRCSSTPSGSKSLKSLPNRWHVVLGQRCPGAKTCAAPVCLCFVGQQSSGL